MKTPKREVPIKILVIRLGALGDVLMTTPALRCLSENHEVEIYFLTKPASASLLEGNPYIHEVLVFKRSLFATLFRLYSLNFDYVADLHHVLRSTFLRKGLQFLNLILRFTYLPCGTYPKYSSLRRSAIKNHDISSLPKDHVSIRYFKAFKPTLFPNLTYDLKGLEYFGNPSIKTQLPPLPQNYIVIAVGSKHFTKQIPTELIVGFCRLIDPYTVVLIGDDSDSDLAKTKEICKQFPCGKYSPISLCGRLSLPQSAEIVRNANLVISGDSLVMHLAAALNKPLISIWGSTVPELGMFPLFPKENQAPHFLLQRTDVLCRPCHKHGRPSCPLRHFNCMQYSPDLLFKKAKEMLSL